MKDLAPDGASEWCQCDGRGVIFLWWWWHWTKEDEALLDGGGGGGHTVDPVTGDPPLSPLTPDLGARILVGLPCTPTWILAVCRGPGLSGESNTEKISLGSSSSSAFPSPPSPCPDDENLRRLDATR
jgi:hypothetical protein